MRLELNHAMNQYVASEKNKTLNLVIAKLSLVITDRKHKKGGEHGRKVVTLDLNSERNFSHIEHFYSSRQINGVPKSLLFHRDVLQTSPLHTHDTINAHYGSNQFHRRFHHSERALYAHLMRETTFDQFIEQFTKAVSGKSGLKVYAFALHLHSMNSLCSSCEDSMFYQYHPQGGWVRKLTQKLKDSGYKVLTKADTLASCVTVSFDKISKTSKKREQLVSKNALPIMLNHKQKGCRVVVLERNDSNSPIKSPRLFSNYSDKTREKHFKLLRKDREYTAGMQKGMVHI